MFLTILFAALGLVAVFLVIAALQPSAFTVRRSALMAAPPAVVFGYINELRQWQAWSPWAKKDPNARNTCEGPAAGPGASYGWDGNNQVGAGQMTITESREPELVALRLDFQRPFKATNMAEFHLRPQAAGTEVEWSMTGKRNLIFKAMGLLIDCDKMIGRDFEQGLDNLQAVTRADASVAA